MYIIYIALFTANMFNFIVGAIPGLSFLIKYSPNVLSGPHCPHYSLDKHWSDECGNVKLNHIQAVASVLS